MTPHQPAFPPQRTTGFSSFPTAARRGVPGQSSGSACNGGASPPSGGQCTLPQGAGAVKGASGAWPRLSLRAAGGACHAGVRRQRARQICSRARFSVTRAKPVGPVPPLTRIEGPGRGRTPHRTSCAAHRSAGDGRRAYQDID
eukprot:scaffold2551_cov376-Prasinococcus_capsulatus_cf.AAC.10